MRQRGGDLFLETQPQSCRLQTQSHKLRPDPKNQLLPPHYSSSSATQDTPPNTLIGHQPTVDAPLKIANEGNLRSP